MTDAGPVRWGIIGCGDVCEVKSGPALAKAEGSLLVAVMRRDAARAADFARRHGVPRWYADAGALLADPQVDAVYVATPPAYHCQYTLLAAQAGKPVYVEKPMATTAAQCDQMNAACQAAGVPLWVAYYRRALPRFVRLKEIIDSGVLGRLRTVAVTLQQGPDSHHLNPQALPWRVRPEIAGGGLFVDLASHTLDLLDHLLGPIVDVSGEASNQAGLYAAEDTVSARFRFASGVQGVGQWCFVAAHRMDRTEIVGSRGRISFATFAEEPLRLEVQSQQSVVPGDGSAGREDIRIAHPAHVHQPLVQLVVAQLRGGAMAPSTGGSGARTNRVIDAVLANYRQGHGF